MCEGENKELDGFLTLVLGPEQGRDTTAPHTLNLTSMNSTRQLLPVSSECMKAGRPHPCTELSKEESNTLRRFGNKTRYAAIRGFISACDRETTNWHRASPLTSSPIWPLTQPQEKWPSRTKSDIRSLIQPWHQTETLISARTLIWKKNFVMNDFEFSNDRQMIYANTYMFICCEVHAYKCVFLKRGTHVTCRPHKHTTGRLRWPPRFGDK